MNFIKKHKITLIILSLSCLFLTAFEMYNKRVNVLIDGELEVIFTNAIKYDFLAKNIAEEYGFDDYKYEADKGKDFIVHNDFVVLNSKKDILVKLNNEVNNIETYSATTDELIVELELENTETVEYVPAESGLLKNMESLHIIKVETVYEDVIAKEDLEEVIVEDPNVTLGIRSSISSGVPSEFNETYKIVYTDGEVYSKELINRELIKEGTAPTVSVGTKEIPTLPPNYATGDTVWDSIASCESGGNWSTNTGNGYYGGLQFSEQSWNTASNAVGVDADYAHLASREDQIKAAEWMLSRSSWKQQWPHCSKQLGLW